MRIVNSLIAFLLPLLVAATLLAEPTPDDKMEILSLLEALSAKSIKPADALDPSLGEQQRKQALTYFSTFEYELNLQPVGEVVLDGPDSAKVPVNVRFITKNREIEAKSSASFVRRSGRWYLANYDFLSFPPVLIVVTIVSSVVGIAYAPVVVLLWRKLVRSGKLGIASGAKIFIPIYWPGLFRASQ